MTKEISVLTAVVTAVLLCVVTLAQVPVLDINAKLHPNLAAAQRYVVEANRAVETAQKANRSDMGGHAEKARHLLEMVNQELKAAAETDNAHDNAAKKKP